jgi:hypothetical protein
MSGTISKTQPIGQYVQYQRFHDYVCIVHGFEYVTSLSRRNAQMTAFDTVPSEG